MSQRVEQLNSLVMAEVSRIIARELEFPLGTLVTVVKADVADDAESAKVSISVLPADKGEKALEIINHHIRDIQKTLNRKLVMKFVPKLTFFLDTTNEKASKITDVLDSIRG